MFCWSLGLERVELVVNVRVIRRICNRTDSNSYSWTLKIMKLLKIQRYNTNVIYSIILESYFLVKATKLDLVLLMIIRSMTPTTPPMINFSFISFHHMSFRTWLVPFLNWILEFCNSSALIIKTCLVLDSFELLSSLHNFVDVILHNTYHFVDIFLNRAGRMICLGSWGHRWNCKKAFDFSR